MSRTRGRGRWRPGSQHAPRLTTIVVSALLVLVGALLTLGLPALADALALSAGLVETLEWVGVGAAAVAMALMLLGVFLEGI